MISTSAPKLCLLHLIETGTSNWSFQLLWCTLFYIGTVRLQWAHNIKVSKPIKLYEGLWGVFFLITAGWCCPLVSILLPSMNFCTSVCICCTVHFLQMCETPLFWSLTTQGVRQAPVGSDLSFVPFWVSEVLKVHDEKTVTKLGFELHFKGAGATIFFQPITHLQLFYLCLFKLFFCLSPNHICHLS